MKKNKLKLIILTILLPITLFSQVKINGKIVDTENKPVEFSEIILLTKDSIALKSELSDEKGNFQIEEKKGDYILQIRQLGNILYNKQLILDKTIDLGILKVETSNNLQEIVISGNKRLIERKVDRLVFNVENSISASGGDALDALKITPRLKVQNDQITMIGKSGMSVMINGRIIQLSGEDLINYLKSLKSDDIKSIEVITTPPAKYDAEGNSGIVNIILKTAKNNSWNTSINLAYQQSKYSQFNESISLIYNKDNFSFYGSLFHTDGLSFYRTENGNIFYTDKYTNSLSKMKSDNENNISSNFGLDYNISNKLSLGFQYLYSKSNVSNSEQNDTEIYAENNYSIQTVSDGASKRNNNSLNFHSTYKLDSLGSNVTFNSDYFNYGSNKNLRFTTNEYEDFINYINDSYNSANNLSKQDISNYSAAIDVEQVFKKTSISYGGKISNTKSTSNINYFDLTAGAPILDSDKSDKFKYSENMQALYLSGNKKLGEKWETKLGLRMESTQTEGYSYNLNQTNTNNYTKLFPTFYLLYKPTEYNSFSINYSKRINRPSYTILNPFVRYINPYTTSEGNPFLQPYFTDNIELTHTYKNNWTSSLYYSKADNIYGQVSFITNNNINSATKRLNYYDQFSIGLYESFTFHPVKKLESNNSMDVYYKKINSFLPETSSNYDGLSAFLETDNNYVLNENKTYFISFDFWYQFPQYYSIYKFKGYSNLDLGFKSLWLDKKLIFTIYASDVFKTLKNKNTSVFNGINTSFENYENRQSIRFTLKYSFGNNTNNIKSINSSNQEEKQRAN
ncbi:MAG: TonB-dependent receptor [Lutibacter sp.]